ncbi:MAG TPA: hypothetical protein PLQ56_05045 [Aggregatilineales bacterium]|nr:hypothetical protein [Aggregatilineales bacterium]
MVPTQTWEIPMDGQTVQVSVTTPRWWGTGEIRVNDMLLHPAEIQRRGRNERMFTVGKQIATIKPNLLGEPELSIAGQKVEPINPKTPIPSWGWGLIAACVGMPILTLGGALPFAIGFGGADGCTSVLRSSMPATTRAILSVGIVILCWVGLIVFLGLIRQVV